MRLFSRFVLEVNLVFMFRGSFESLPTRKGSRLGGLPPSALMFEEEKLPLEE